MFPDFDLDEFPSELHEYDINCTKQEFECVNFRVKEQEYAFSFMFNRHSGYVIILFSNVKIIALLEDYINEHESGDSFAFEKYMSNCDPTKLYRTIAKDTDFFEFINTFLVVVCFMVCKYFSLIVEKRNLDIMSTCTVCKTNYVNPENGEDTCNDCLRKL